MRWSHMNDEQRQQFAEAVLPLLKRACERAGLTISKHSNLPTNVGLTPELALAISLNEMTAISEPSSTALPPAIHGESDEAFKVRILWGSEAAREETDEPSEYSFQTQGELDAFLQGVEEMNGWADYKQIDPNPDGSWPDPDED